MDFHLQARTVHSECAAWLNQWSRILEKIITAQLANKFSISYEI
jgi:hypothetical protein